MMGAFVRRAQPGLLLPQMVAVGDLALDNILPAFFDTLDAAAEIPAAIAPMQRLFLLVKMISENYLSSGQTANPNELLRLGRYLAEVIDELDIEKVGFGQFADIEPEGELAGHWQNSYAQMRKLIPQYNAALVAMNRLGPAARRNLLLERLANSMKTQRPTHLIVAAGISTSAPAIANLLKTIAVLPNSLVIFPAIDLTMSDEQWERLGPVAQEDTPFAVSVSRETHPQFHLKLLLDRMGFRRDEIDQISTSAANVGDIISQIFNLAEETENWRSLDIGKKKLTHVKLLTASDSADEARAIAILVREALETAGKRIAVVTPDRELAVRVSAQLKRWQINVNDSAGSPLLQSPGGSLFMALARVIADNFAPISLLAVIKHPLVMSGDGRLDWLENARLLDIILRGPNPGIGLNAISNAIAKSQSGQADSEQEIASDFGSWWADLQSTLSSLEFAASCAFSDVLAAIQSVAQILTKGVIWRGEAGRQLSALVEELNAQNLPALGAIGRDSIASVLGELFNREAVRSPYGGHPRVAVYGLLEARLQQADLVICAGLNEGTWPQLPQPDPWLAPRVRRELKLPGLERNVGLSAHDIAAMLGATEVILTRATRDRSGPTIASRFVLRLQAFLGNNLKEEHRVLALSRLLETPDVLVKSQKPAPVPTREQRSQISLSVTDFDRLMADPYAFYANKILRIKTLEAVDALPSYAWRGSMVHEILERWAKEDKCDPAKLMERAAGLLSNSAVHPALRALWQPRVAEGLRWIAEKTAEMAANGRELLVAEARGTTEIEGVKLRGRADRIDKLPDGSLAIIDYKTGNAPSLKSVTKGFALQLGLIGFMAESGGIDKVSGDVNAFEYWSLGKDKSNFGKISKPVDDSGKYGKIHTDAFVVFAHGKASEAIREWITGSAAFTAKLHPEYAPYADYNQLMRYDEWNGREPLAEGEAQ